MKEIFFAPVSPVDAKDFAHEGLLMRRAPSLKAASRVCARCATAIALAIVARRVHGDVCRVVPFERCYGHCLVKT